MKKKKSWKSKSKQKGKKQPKQEYDFSNEKWYKKLNEYFGLT